MPFQQMLTQLAQKRQGQPQGPAKGFLANAAQRSGKQPGTPRAPQSRPQRAPMQAKPPMSAPSMPMPGQAPTPLALTPMAQPPMSLPSPVQGGGALGMLRQKPKMPSQTPPQGSGLLQMLQLLAQKRQQPQNPTGGNSGEATTDLPNSQF